LTGIARTQDLPLQPPAGCGKSQQERPAAGRTCNPTPRFRPAPAQCTRRHWHRFSARENGEIFMAATDRQHAVITGVPSGIGAAVAARLASDGLRPDPDRPPRPLGRAGSPAGPSRTGHGRRAHRAGHRDMTQALAVGPGHSLSSCPAGTWRTYQPAARRLRACVNSLRGLGDELAGPIRGGCCAERTRSIVMRRRPPPGRHWPSLGSRQPSTPTVTSCSPARVRTRTGGAPARWCAA
jgi:hypothetical protein